jgi:hypothetical protein
MGGYFSLPEMEDRKGEDGVRKSKRENALQLHG